MAQLDRFIAQVLGIDGFEVAEAHWETSSGLGFLPVGPIPVSRDARLVVTVRRRLLGRCSGCARRCKSVHEHLAMRRWLDLPWCGRPVSIAYSPDRLWCPSCHQATIELLPWADRYQRETSRLQQHLALQAMSMPTAHVAAQYGLEWHTVRRAEKHALQRWDATRQPVPLMMVGVDEKYLGRRGKRESKYITIVSNLETGEPLWIGAGRSEATLQSWLATLSALDKSAIKLFALDMHGAYVNAIRGDPALAHADIVHDPFHVMKRALQAIDDLRRQTFFRAGPQMRGLGRGKRWLFLRAWERQTAEQRIELKRLLRLNVRLAHAYQVVEELRAVLHVPDELAMTIGLVHVMRRIERRDNVPMRKLHDSLDAHFKPIVALGKHHPPTGRIEALNNNWETAVRQGRGYRDLTFLLLKVRFMTANAIRDDDGTKRFLALGLPAPYKRAA